MLRVCAPLMCSVLLGSQASRERAPIPRALPARAADRAANREAFPPLAPCLHAQQAGRDFAAARACAL
eukprot:5481354-Pleurochrysis_carterae.AAC.1